VAVKKNISELPVLRHYDKLLVVVALVVLLVSLAYLVTAGMARDVERGGGESSPVADKIKAMKANPKPVEAVSMAAFEHATKLMASQSQIQAAEIRREHANFLTPECRVACVKCTKPIPEKAAICPFCGLKQQEVITVDPTHSTLKDGVPDVFKRKYGINIREAGAANADLDGDGFSLLEEFLAGTDPTDPKSRPAYTEKLQLKELRGKLLPLRFTAVNKMPDGHQLTFNWTERRAPRTYWIRENKPIGETGFTAGELSVKFEKREGMADKDVSTVIVKRDSDGKEIELQINEKEKNTDVEAIFVFLVENSELVLLENQEFKLRDETYRVVSISEKDGDGSVVVEDTVSGKQKTFKKSP